MKLLRFRVVPPRDGLHPVDAALAEDPAVQRRAIHLLQLLEDDTAAALFEVEGPRDRVEAILEEAPSIVSSHLTSSGLSLHGYLHFEPSDLVERMLRTRKRHGILLQMPLEYTADGDLRLTVVGELDAIQRAVPEMPRGLHLELEHVSDYRPGQPGLYGQLTAAQQRVLRAAIEHGYYEDPRAIGYRGLAEELGLSPTTVGEHLRKAEAAIVRAVVP